METRAIAHSCSPALRQTSWPLLNEVSVMLDIGASIRTGFLHRVRVPAYSNGPISELLLSEDFLASRGLSTQSRILSQGLAKDHLRPSSNSSPRLTMISFQSHVRAAPDRSASAIHPC